MEAKRFSQLDSLRGIAALIVVFCHLDAVAGRFVAHSAWGALSPLHWLVEGDAAVIFFFVLSGYVLSLPYIRGAEPSYGAYITKRFFRLYLPSLFSLLVAGGLWFFLVPVFPDVLFPWNLWVIDYHNGVDWRDFMGQLSMSGLDNTGQFNPPIWSLIIEIRAAFLFPLMYLVVHRYGGRGLLLLCCFGILMGGLGLLTGGIEQFYYAKTLLGSALLTLYFFVFFLVGIFLAIYSSKAVELFNAQEGRTHIYLILVMLFLPAVFMKNVYFLQHYWYALVSVYVLVAALASARFKLFLQGCVVRWLGKVSFSLYIIHVPVLYAFLYVLGDYLPHYAIYLIFLPTVFVLSEITYLLVERPSKNLGYFVAGKIGKRGQ